MSLGLVVTAMGGVVLGFAIREVERALGMRGPWLLLLAVGAFLWWQYR